MGYQIRGHEVLRIDLCRSGISDQVVPFLSFLRNFADIRGIGLSLGRHGAQGTQHVAPRRS